MATYLREHRINVNKSLLIPKSQLQKGMIVSGRYKSQEGGSSDYIVLILQPNWEKKIHGLSLKEVDPGVIKDLAARVGTKLVYGNRFKQLQIPKLIMNQSSYRFYNSKLKGPMASEYNTSYRTFNMNGFSNVFLLDYDF